MTTKSMQILVLFLAVLGVTVSAGVLEPVNASRFGKVAIKGYDPVAYFVAGAPLKGKKAFATEYLGATWRFANAENLAAFEAEPQKYAPQYGGYCAWAVAQGSTASIDPAAWRIVDGKLYLNYDKKVQSDWEKDFRGFIRSADKNWPKLLK